MLKTYYLYRVYNNLKNMLFENTHEWCLFIRMNRLQYWINKNEWVDAKMNKNTNNILINQIMDMNIFNSNLNEKYSNRSPRYDHLVPLKDQ